MEGRRQQRSDAAGGEDPPAAADLINRGGADVDEPLAFDLPAAAQRLRVGAEWLACQARAGKVPHVRMGRSRRFTEANLVAILALFEQPTAPAPLPPAVDSWARPVRGRRRVP